MPEIVDDIPHFRRTKHNWDEYFDGRTRKFVTGRDFRGKVASFSNYARIVARNRGVKATILVRDGAVFISAEVESETTR